MSTVGVKELKNRLTEYLRRTKKGEEIIITERGKPIAVIQAIGSADKLESTEAKLAQLAGRGLVSLPTRKPQRGIHLVKVSGSPLSKEILEERR